MSDTTGGTFAGTFGFNDAGPNVAVGALALGPFEKQSWEVLFLGSNPLRRFASL